MDLNAMQLDLVAFRAKYAEAVKEGLLTDHQVWERFIYN